MTELVTKLHTLYICPPEAWEHKLFTIFKECTAKYNNEYLDDRSWKAHITIGTHALSDEKTEDFIEACDKVSQTIKPFKIHFEGFSKSEDGSYIFLDFDKEASEKISTIREQFINQTNQLLGPAEIPEKYLEQMDTFTHAEKKRLLETGNPYKFTPHISIVKLEPFETNELYEEVKDHELLGEGFTANTLMVSKQTNDSENLFPVIKTYEL